MTATETRMAPPVGLPRLLPPSNTTLSLSEHLARYGLLPPVAPDLVSVVEASRLRGRGGAGFPTARKLAAVAGAAGPRAGRAVVVANGCESEPASAKDRTLLTLSPHLVLDGIAVAVGLVGAGEAFVCLEQSASASGRALEAAIGERSDPVPVEIVTVPRRYVAGEETALVSRLNGGTGLPAFVPPRPYERGVHGRPTLIDNVESLAHLALVARYGSAWFQSVGSPTTAGSMLVTITGAVARPGVMEAAPGTSLGELLAASGGATEALSAVLVGGFFGTWLAPSAALARPLDLSVGAGVVLAFPASACGLAEVARLARWLARQSAGQCGPCVNGLPAMASGVEALLHGRSDQQVVANLQRRLAQAPGRGACHLPDGFCRVIATGLNLFGGEIRGHAEGRCTARHRVPVLPLPT